MDRKKAIRAIRLPLEWAGIWLGVATLSFLPRKALLGVCDFASLAMYLFDRRGRRRALANLRIVLGKSDVAPGRHYADGAKNPVRREKLVIRRSYRNMARTVGHAFWTCRNAKARAAQAGSMCAEGKAFLRENRPAVTVSGHIGCWEILSQLAFLEGHRMMSVAKDVGSAGMTRMLMKARRSIGQEIVHAGGAMKPLLQGIRDGKSLGLLVDQAVKPGLGGMWVRFFGRPYPVSAAPAFFAAKGNAPIAVAWSRPLKDGTWRCEVVSTYPAREARDIWRTTQNCMRDLERVIRRHPSCWALNYNAFRIAPGAEELAQLEKRESAQ